jgi:uncharacterized HAD superfamily protein
MSEEQKPIGIRFDQNKIRHDLVSANAINELAKVLTFGAQKYAPNNWRLGMAWSRVLGSSKRHLNAIERGEDYDPETGLLHAAHVMCNMMFLTDYYKIYPQGDDRPHDYLTTLKIGLDIDGVLADFQKQFCEFVNIPFYDPTHWNDPVIKSKFEELKKNSNFWLSMPVLTPASEINFEPHCYITSRSIPIEITQEWLNKNNYPAAPLYCIPFNESKVEIAKRSGVEIFVDDKFQNFVELNAAGICTFLFDSAHNKFHEVGYKRIKSLNELINK